MIPVRKFQPDNKLAGVLEDRNGLLMTQAVQRAAGNVESLREEHLVLLDGKVDQLCSIAAAAMTSQSEADSAQIYRLAREILADAGVFGLKPVSRVAHSLCDLMAAGARHPHQWAGVKVHSDAMLALRRLGRTAGGAGVESMIAGLETISRASVPTERDVAG